MKRAHHTRMVAGVGTAVGAVILGSLLAGCAPGTICHLDEYEEQCRTGNSAGGSGGSGGSNSGTGGSSTGGSMMPAASGGMGGSGSPPPKVTCKLYTTKEEVADKIVMGKCAVPGGICHATTFPPKFTNSGEAIMAMLDKAPAIVCKNDKLINKADPSKSFIVAKVRGAGPMISCPSGGMNNGGAKMPFTPNPALSNDEADCLEWWAYEVSK